MGAAMAPMTMAPKGGDETGRRGDGHQADHRAGGDAQYTGLAGVAPGEEHPAQGSGRGGGVGVDKGVGGQAVGGQGTARVEAEPPEPQEAGAQHGVGDVMRLHGGLWEALAGPDGYGEGKGREPGRDMHHGAAREVQGSHGSHPAAVAPHPVAQGIIYYGCPEQSEDQEGLEAHPLHEGAGDQGRRDHREHHLEGGECKVRDFI